MRYTQIHDGDWVQPRRRNYYLQCCGCRLTHRINFKVVKGVLQFQAFRIRERGPKKRTRKISGA